MKKDHTLDDYIYIATIISIFIMIILYIIYVLIGKPSIFNCIIYDKFGIYCPGCGCTRALINIFQGNILKSLYYNPTVLYSIVVVIIYIITNTIKKLSKKNEFKYVLKYNQILIYIGIVILISTCIIKNILNIL